MAEAQTHVFRVSLSPKIYRDFEILSAKNLYDLARAGMPGLTQVGHRARSAKFTQADIGDGFSALAGKSGKVRKYRCDQIAMMAVVRSQARGV